MTTLKITTPEITSGLIFQLVPQGGKNQVTRIEKRTVYFTCLKHNRFYKVSKSTLKGYLIGYELLIRK
jgi:hypothetical protein